jgi:hypothetical protein
MWSITRKMADYVRQVPDSLLEEIRHAHEEMGRIVHLLEGVMETILSEDMRWMDCRRIAEQTEMNVDGMMETGRIPTRTALRMIAEGVQIPNTILTKVRQILPTARAARALLEKTTRADNKEEMRVAFVDAIKAMKDLEGRWREIYEYAKAVPREAPRKERQRGGRKRRTHRKRNYKRTRRNR